MIEKSTGRKEVLDFGMVAQPGMVAGCVFHRVEIDGSLMCGAAPIGKLDLTQTPVAVLGTMQTMKTCDRFAEIVVLRCYANLASFTLYYRHD